MRLERVGKKHHFQSGPKPPLTALKRILERIQRGIRWTGTHVPKAIELKVHLAYDEEADCWYVAQSDVPGLCLEAPTAPSLVERVMQIAPELICLNLAELERKHVPESHRQVELTPVFDSPLRLAHA